MYLGYKDWWDWKCGEREALSARMCISTHKRSGSYDILHQLYSFEINYSVQCETKYLYAVSFKHFPYLVQCFLGESYYHIVEKESVLVWVNVNLCVM